MKIARICIDDEVLVGEYIDGKIVTEDNSFQIDNVELLPPCSPSAFYCIGRNYGEKIDQMDYDVPDQPDWFIKPAVSVHQPEKPIEYPRWTEKFTYAGELAAVIEEKCSDLKPKQVENYLWGYTILNDLDALDQPGRTARKAFNGSAPLGPWIETDLDPTGIDMKTEINGEIRQQANTEQMLFSPNKLISHLSERYTFMPGDVISFGSPANPGLIEPGDNIEIWYEGVGTLKNNVVENS